VAEVFITQSAEETIRWGRELAARLKPPVLVLLSGELGTGKTTLAKGIVSGLGAAREEEVTSPTFTLVHVYGRQPKVYHADLYRVESLADYESLGLEDVFAASAIVIIEWPKPCPLPTTWPQVRIRLEHVGGEVRRITTLPTSDR